MYYLYSSTTFYFFEGAVKGRNTVKSTFKSNIDIFLVFSHKHGFCQSDSFFREFQRDDINKVADIWLDTNIKAHNFIPAEYWKSNFRSVKEALLLAEVYVYEYDTEIQGFIGLNDEYVEGIFVSGEMQSQGIGKILLNYAKDKRNKLHLNVYQKNARAISFYKREGFEIQHSGLDEATGEKDYVMTWQYK